jgi:hypothetical protein
MSYLLRFAPMYVLAHFVPNEDSIHSLPPI